MILVNFIEPSVELLEDELPSFSVLFDIWDLVPTVHVITHYPHALTHYALCMN